MSSRLTMAREGTLIVADGISLSWPEHGEREVIDLPAEERGPRIRRAVFEGKVIETDLPATTTGPLMPAPRLLQGEEARRHFAEPAGPIVRVVVAPAIGIEDETVTEAAPVTYVAEIIVEPQPVAEIIVEPQPEPKPKRARAKRTNSVA